MLPVRLNLGCGSVYLDDYINIDQTGECDLIHDLNKKLPFEDASVSHIYASHVLEHFPYSHTQGLLKDWMRVLKDGGTLHIRVPDLVECCKRFVKNKDGKQWTWWLKTIYGGQWHEGEFHKTGFDKARLIEQVQMACEHMQIAHEPKVPQTIDPEINIIFKKIL